LSKNKILLSLALVFIGCCAATCFVIRHSEEKAGAEAEKFAELAFVKQDFEAAYSRLDPVATGKVSLDVFTAQIKSMHAGGYPSKVAAKAFQIETGKGKGVWIYLEGESAEKKFYYRVGLLGNAASGYKVAAAKGLPSAIDLTKLKRPLSGLLDGAK